MIRRRPPLPDHLRAAWEAFLDCADVVEGGRRRLLRTLPAGRVEPAPVNVGLSAVDDAIADARRWMPLWQADEVATWWQACADALDEAAAAVPTARKVAEETSELEDLLGAVADVVEPLDAFADAERVWRRRWRVPPRRRGT